MSNHIFCRVFNNIFNDFAGMFKGTEKKLISQLLTEGIDQEIKRVGTCPQRGRGRYPGPGEG